MRKAIVLAVIAMLVLLAACGGNQMKAKPLSARTPNGASTVTPSPAPAVAAPTPATTSNVTAAEAIKELQQQIQTTPTTKSPTVVNTGIPPAPAGLTGRDAMLARMKLYMNQSAGVKDVTGVTTKLPDYSKSSNLPDEYIKGGQYDN